MNVSMTTLAVGMVAALFLGVGLWLVFVALVFLARLFLGVAKEQYKRARQVGREVFFALFCICATFAIIVFLYLVNRGVVRWFLLFAILGGFFIPQRFLFHYIDGKITRFSLIVRRIVLQFLVWVTYPVRLVLGGLFSLLGKLLWKCHLHITRICDKINVRNYDRRQRKRLFKFVMREVEYLSQKRNV